MNSNALDLKRALEVATRAALEAGAAIRAEFHRAGGPRKEGADCAEVDREAERLIRATLTLAFPDHDLLDEQSPGPVLGGGRPTWYVAPHDGAAAYLRGWRGSAVSVGLVVDGLPVLGVVYAPCAPTDAGDLLSWAEGEPLRRNGAPLRRAPLSGGLGSASVVLLSPGGDRTPEANAAACAPARFRTVPSLAYRCALVAAGEGEVAVSLDRPVARDLVGGHALLRGAGGELLGDDGQPLRHDGPQGRPCERVFGGALEAARALVTVDWGRMLRGGRPGGAPLLPSADHKVADPGLLDRAQGALLGQVIGDALGQLVEFRDEASIRRQYPDGVLDLVDGGAWHTLAGQPTDDSELALALARSLVAEGAFDSGAVRRAYVRWLDSHPFDVGNTTRAGLRGRPDLGSQANGALMRVSPLAVFGQALPAPALAALARLDAALTHPHPVCGDASAVYAVALAHAVRTGAAPGDVYQVALDCAESERASPTVLQALRDAAQGPPPHYGKQQGWVLIALRNAFYQLLHAGTAEAGVVDTVRRGGDTDTNGAIAGALLGAVHGGSQLPVRWTRPVLSCRALSCVHPRPPEYWPVDVAVLAEALLVHGRAQRG
jgi:ADP-ribosylglycohydrolase/fructose-1,6-bisphosphatase/inositol monophosphatase family enzyme